MILRFVNGQRRDPVPAAWVSRVAGCAARRLKIRGPGVMAVAFVDSRTMRRFNRRFTGHAELTDVLSFRYDRPAPPPLRSAKQNGRGQAGREPIVGEIIVAPASARIYAARHGLPYRRELARYVLHGLLHWLGHEDATLAQQRHLRRLEDHVLNVCTRRRRG